MGAAENGFDRAEVLDGALRRAFAREPDAQATSLSARYRPVEVIGRGGMGVVHRAHEIRLEREIAVKTLRADLAKDPSMVSRFLREARILAALDHPAIVSVHDLGTTPDGLPFLTMRLIRGESLEAVLSKRVDLADGSARLHLVFQGICQAMAYAHEQGVLHRDLKPANVMIGPHGEIQVVDWGLARHVDGHASFATVVQSPDDDEDDPRSRSGSPMGTPAYMAPELARAEHGAVGYQTDVFGLGSILCEILTGEPPHSGTPLEALRAAATGEMTGAIERLEASSAPRELVALAVRCLGAVPAERPANAGAVNRQFSRCLAKMDRDARQSQLDAVASQTQATEERKRRRITVALSAVIVGLVLSGTLVWAFMQADQLDRREGVENEVERSLTKATNLRMAARTDGSHDETLWRRALDASALAHALSRTPDVSEAWRRRVDAEYAMSEVGLSAATKAATGRRELATATSELADARTLRLTDCSLLRCDAAYRAFLLRRGIDGTSQVADIAARAARLGDIGPMVVAALDEWSEVRYVLRATGAPSVTHLTSLARAADPEPWRDALRRHIGTRDRGELRALLVSADPASLDEQSLALAALWIGTIRQRGQAKRWYATAELRFPRNPWIHHVAALEHLRKGRPAAAAASWRAALAVRPEIPALWRGLASALVETDPEDAVEVSQMAIAKGMRCSKLWIELGRAHAALGDDAEAIKALEHAVQIAKPGDADPLVYLADVHAGAGRSDVAMSTYRDAIERDEDSVRAHVGIAEEYAAAGRPQDVLAHLEIAQQRVCKCPRTPIAKRIARLADGAKATSRDE